MGIPKIFKRNKPVDDDKVINKTKKNFLWVQEFSKKVIVALLIIYVLYFAACVYFLYKMLMAENITGFETLTTEINETFRFIVGGYLIKAGIENVSKITGNYYGSISKLKILNMKKEQGLEIQEDIEQMDQELKEQMDENFKELSQIDES